MRAATTLVVVLAIVSASVWVGSLVCLALVADAARGVLDDVSQVALFRAIGRRYAVVGTVSLLVAVGSGLELAWPPSSWSATVDVAVGLAGLLVVATAAGMAQARAMTALRRRSIRTPADARLRRAVGQGRRVATALPGLIALITIAIVVLAAAAMSH
jgi:asparagine N-glycosylation enzyme membrane subunit Stt3